MNLLRAEPDARPDAIERARALVADPTYPSSDLLKQVARRLLSQIGQSK